MYGITSVELYIPGTQDDQLLPGTSGYQGPGTTRDQGGAHMDKKNK